MEASGKVDRSFVIAIYVYISTGNTGYHHKFYHHMLFALELAKFKKAGPPARPK